LTFFCLYVLFRFALPFLFCLHVFVVLAKKIVVFVILFLNVFFIDYFSVFYYFCLLCICTCCCFLFVFQMSPSKRSTHKWLPHLRMSPILISLITLTSSSCHKQASKKVIVVASKASWFARILQHSNALTPSWPVKDRNIQAIHFFEKSWNIFWKYSQIVQK
jgi:hypothetical protein